MRLATTLRIYLLRTVLAKQDNCGSVGCAYVLCFGRYSDVLSMSKFIIPVLVSMCQKPDCRGYVVVCSSNDCVDGNGILSCCIIRKYSTEKNNVWRFEKKNSLVGII